MMGRCGDEDWTFEGCRGKWEEAQDTDKLRKTKAGQYFIALMSTILPVLPEDDCDKFTGRLFEECAVSTPTRLQALVNSRLFVTQPRPWR